MYKIHTTTAGSLVQKVPIPRYQRASLQLTVPTVVPDTLPPEGAKISKALRDVNSGVN